jgi:hypothetical protein
VGKGSGLPLVSLAPRRVSSLSIENLQATACLRARLGFAVAMVWMRLRAHRWRLAGISLPLRAAGPAQIAAVAPYLVFEHGRDLDADTVRYAQKLGVAVVPSINIFHYADTDHWKAAEADTKRMMNLGVEYFQIDSPYDVWLR